MLPSLASTPTSSTEATLARIGTEPGSVKSKDVLKMHSQRRANRLRTIFSMVLVMVENLTMSKLLTTTAGVVKKNSTMNNTLLMSTVLKYQKRDGMAKLPLSNHNRLVTLWTGYRSKQHEALYQLISSGRGAKSTDQRCGLKTEVSDEVPGLEPQNQSGR